MKALRRRLSLLFTFLLTASLAYGWLWATPRSQLDTPPAVVGAPVELSSSPLPDDEDEGGEEGATAALPELPTEALPAPLLAQPTRTPSLRNTRNILVAGLDRRPDGKGPSLTDTLLVVVLDEASSHVGLVSIPRDLLVEIPQPPRAEGEVEPAATADAGDPTLPVIDRINTVYSAAKRSRRDPMALLAQVVSDTLRLPIANTLVLDLAVFERAVDAVGGVEVDVPCPIADRFHDTRVEGGRRELDLDAGLVRMDGPTAAMYARSRHGRSDFHRARRQQAILVGVQRALSGLGVAQFPDLYAALESSVQTDLKRIQLVSLARKALSVNPSHLHGLVLGGRHVQHTWYQGKSVLLPKYEVIDASLGKLFDEPSPGTEPKATSCPAKDIALTAAAR